jgi:site-specific DNA-adenine methylase
VKAPFPYFGGKSTVAEQVWALLGDVDSYVEPFCGSAAVLLARPQCHTGRVETVNDADCYIANFWRALRAAPDDVAAHVDWPLNECDLEARHGWLVNQSEWRARMKSDPDHFDAKIAGWWCWGASQWIGGGWCDRASSEMGSRARRPSICLAGVNKTTIGIAEWLRDLAGRLRRVLVMCGDWSRVVASDSALGLTDGDSCGVFLDPPYSNKLRRNGCYTHDDGSVAAEAAQWAREHGCDKRMRIVLCGYDGEHDMPGWRQYPWAANGGYGNKGHGRGRDNAGKEVLWISPHCLGGGVQESLF